MPLPKSYPKPSLIKILGGQLAMLTTAWLLLLLAVPTEAFVSPRPVASIAPTALRSRIELKDLLYDSTSTAFDAWEWTANLGGECVPALHLGVCKQ